MARTRRVRTGLVAGRWIALAAVAGVAACQGGGETAADNGDSTAEAPHSTADEAMEVGFACADGKSFQIAFVSQEEVRITIDGESHSLERTPGHTGMLYSDDSIVFFSQGREANVEIDGRPAYTDCEAQGHPQ